MLDLLVAGGNNAEAFAYAERATARVVLDVLKYGRTQLPDLTTAEDRQHEETLRLSVASLNAELVRGSDRLQPGQLAALAARLDRARLQYEVFETALYSRHPDWKLQSGATEPISLDQALELG